MTGKRLAPAGAAFLLALFVWMAVSVSRSHGPVADEPLHLAAGYTYWTRNDFRLQPENGNLPQRWAALPLLAAGLRFPPASDPAWAGADVAALGFRFLFESGNDPVRILLLSRLMVALLGAACGALVWLWSRSLFGWRGGCVSVLLFAFSPSLLAHAGLATSDMAATLGFTAALLACWRLLHRVSPARVLAAGLAGGVLALSKFSAPFLLPVVLVLAFVRLARARPLPVHVGRLRVRLRGLRAAAALAAGFAAAGALAIALIWAAYGFRYAAASPILPGTAALEAGRGPFFQSWATVLLEIPSPVPGSAQRLSAPERELLTPGPVQAGIRLALRGRLLPEAWLYGLAHTLRFSLWRPAFLLGHYRTTGWAVFFPIAFLVKTPLAALALMALAAAALVREGLGPRGWRLAYRLSPLLVFTAAYGSAAVLSHLDIGHRHLLPLYPLLFILAGGVSLGFPWRHPDGIRGCSPRESHLRWTIFTAAGLLLTVHTAGSIATRPDYLAYFNSLCGGPDRAYKVLVDSSLDWGQDLPGLRRWLDGNARPGEPVYLSYFGADDPVTEGIHALRIADGFFDLRPRPLLAPITGGVFCIGATMFQQVYTLVRHGWSQEQERRYQELSRWLGRSKINGLDTSTGPDGRPVGRDALVSGLSELEQLRFGRLCARLANRPPDAEIGHSILVFRLTDAEVARCLSGPPPAASQQP